MVKYVPQARANLEVTVLMSLTDHRPLSSTALLAARFNAVRSWIARLAREIQFRHDMRRLASFDDTMLHDVGLARGGIEDAIRHGRACASRCIL
jgi:hypothetical protein